MLLILRFSFVATRFLFGLLSLSAVYSMFFPPFSSDPTTSTLYEVCLLQMFVVFSRTVFECCFCVSLSLTSFCRSDAAAFSAIVSTTCSFLTSSCCTLLHRPCPRAFFFFFVFSFSSTRSHHRHPHVFCPDCVLDEVS